MKFRTHREFVKYLPLLFWTCKFFSSAESVKQLININVALFGDRTSYGETLFLPNYYNRTKNLTKISLRVNSIPLNGASFGEISRTFCSKILERNVSVIILQTNREKLACYVAHLASYFQIPVINSGNRAPPLPDKVRKKRPGVTYLKSSDSLVFLIYFFSNHCCSSFLLNFEFAQFF